MTASATRAVMDALNEPGDPQTLFVGGCVRNQLLERPVADIDLATTYKPDDVILKLHRAGIHYVPTGIAHGTITAVVEGQTFEITTLRTDLETDGRHATVAFTGDWVKDAERRDFTMNTLLADDSGHIYDPLGRGIADLRAGRVMFVGNPAERIAEDYLRILRFFRFHALYGQGEPDYDALEACKEAASNIIYLSRERVTQEMTKILSVNDPTETLMLMFDNNVALEFRSRNFQRHLFSHFCNIQAEYGAIDVMGRLVMLADMDYDRAGMLLHLSGAQSKRVRDLVLMVRDTRSLNEKTLRKLLYGHDKPNVLQLLMLFMTRDGETPEYRKLFEILKTMDPPKFPLTGRDVLELGVMAGPGLGQLLSEVEEWWIAQDFVPERAACLQRLQQSVQVLGSR
jgi:poly(A) polymerase